MVTRNFAARYRVYFDMDLRLAAVVLAAFCSSPANAAEAYQASVSVVPDQFSAYDTIFVAQLQDTKPVDECSGCGRKVVALVTRVLKGEVRVPTEFEAMIPPFRRFDPRGWNMVLPIAARRRYMIMGRGANDLKSVFQTPEAVFLIRDEEETVGDVELILQDRALSVAEKCAHLVATIVGAKRLRSSFLAGYATDLLDRGNEADTLTLLQTIAHIGGSTFSNTGEWILLSRLWELSIDSQRRPEMQNRAYDALVRVAACSLVTMPDHQTQGVAVPDEWAVRSKFVPIIRSTAEGEAALRAAFQSLASEPEHRLSNAQKGRAREWLRILDLR